jgi:hypothetical protein
MLFKIYRDKIPTHEWLALNEELTFTSRQTKCIINLTSRYKVGFITPSKCLTFIDNTIKLNWLNFSFECFKALKNDNPRKAEKSLLQLKLL